MTLEMVVIRVVTSCTTEDELVAAFARLSGDKALFIPTKTMRTVGLETGFSIRLADGTPKLRGLCVVEGSHPDSDNAWKRPGVHLGIRKLTPDSEPVFARMRDPMLPLIVTDTVQLSPDEARPTVEMPPLFPEIDDCDVTDDATEAVPTPLAEVTMRVPADADRTVKVDTPRETILGMPPLVPPRKDTVKMAPVARAALLAPPRMTGRAPVAIVDEDAGRVILPWRPRLRAWLQWLWHRVTTPARRVTAPARRLSAPAARRAPQAR